MSKRTPNPTDVFVGQRVRMARLMANMSQTDLGNAIGLTFQQVQKYEKGTNRIGSSRMQQIASTLQKPISWFFDEDPKKKNGGDRDLVAMLLTAPDGMDLARAFLAIKNRKARHNVLNVVRSIAEAEAA